MKNKTQYQERYKSKDSEYASILYATKQTLESTCWENGSCYFLFADKDACSQIITDYINDKIVISAKSVMEAIKTIQGIIRSR